MWTKGIADTMVFMFVVGMIISAIVGWGVIEGILWICSHISISWV